MSKALTLGVLILLLSSGCNQPEEPVDVSIYSVTSAPTTDERVTLRNNDTVEADISYWTLGDLNDPVAYGIAYDTVLAPVASITFPGRVLGFQIDDSGETIYLKDGDGNTIDTWSN